MIWINTRPGQQRQPLVFGLGRRNWSTAGTGSDMPYVVSTHLSFSGDEGLLVYTLDEDSNLNNGRHGSLCKNLRNGAWGSAIRLTDNDVADDSPKAVYVDGTGSSPAPGQQPGMEARPDGVIKRRSFRYLQKYEIAAG